MEQLNLIEIFKILKSSYKNIDFRAAYYKKEDNWEFIISFIRFSQKTNEELKKIHKELKERDVNTENFKIEYRVISLDDFEPIWEEIKNSAERTLQPVQENEIKFDINKINKPHFNHYLLEQDKKEFNSIIFTAEFFNKNIEHHNRFNFLKKEIMDKGEKEIYPVIKRALQIENFNLNSPIYCIILFPILVKIDTSSIKFVNNYINVNTIFHDFFFGSELFLEIIDYSNIISHKGSYMLTSERDKIKKFKYEKRTDGFTFVRFIYHFGMIPFSELNITQLRLIVRMKHPQINDFLIDFEIPLKNISSTIEGMNKIPEDLYFMIDPFLKINLLDRQKSRETAGLVINDFLQNKSLEIAKTIIKFIEWLINPESIRSLRNFFINAANNPNSAYHNFFIELIIKSCYKAIDEELLDDDKIISKINDLLIIYNIHIQYSVKFYYFKNSLARLRDDMRYIFEEIFENYPQCNETSKFERGSRFNFDYPSLWSECKGNYQEKIFFEFMFIRNDYSRFNYHNVHLTLRISDIDWNLIPNSDIDKITAFLKQLFKNPNMQIADSRFLPERILSKLKDIPKMKSYHTQHEIVSSQNQFKVINSQKDSREKKYFDFNILIGKNNTGKTRALTMLFHDINTYRTYDRYEKINEFRENYRQFPEFEMFYIPHNRKLSDSIGKSSNIYKSLIGFFETFTDLRSHKYLKEEPINIENKPKEEKEDYWIIPNFIEFIDILSFKLEEEHSLNQKDQSIIEYGTKLFQTFNNVIENWCNTIKEFFPDILIEKLKPIDREGNQCILIEDLYTGREITNWKSLGSGTQQLLNLIFLIEYLKIGPVVNIKEFLMAIKRNEIENAFKNFITYTYNNRILFIDEPEVSLHPSLQRDFFEYLVESSRNIQIFIATHSPFFLDIPDFINLLGNNLSVTLQIKSETGKFDPLIINKYNILKIIDEIFDYNPIETAFYLSKNDYSTLLMTNKQREFNLLQLKMINNMVKNKFSNNYLDLLKLGTSYEDINPRLIQNAHFMISEPISIDLTESKGKLGDWEQIFVYQINISKYKCIDNKRLEGVSCSCWNPKKAVNEMVLIYTKTQSEDLTERIMNTLNSYQTDEKCNIIKDKSILVFPENSIPYSLLNPLIKYSIKNKIIIIGGMEHIKLHEFKEISNSFSGKYINPLNLYSLQSYPSFKEDVYLNQAVIINSNGCFSFQINNVPVYFNRSEKQENIPIILNPSFFKFKTSIGDIAIFICKDFLVNYSIIDKWMNKNDIALIAVPSFTELVNPFRNKFGEIIHLKKNRKKTFVFANIAEFGGSGIYNFNRERDYEPGKKSPFKAHEEKCECFIKK